MKKYTVEKLRDILFNKKKQSESEAKRYDSRGKIKAKI